MDPAWKKFVEPLQERYDAIEAAFNSAFKEETKKERQVAFEAALAAAQKFRDEHRPAKAPATPDGKAKAPATLDGKAKPVEDDDDDGWQDKVRVEYKLPNHNSRDSHERSYAIDTLIDELDALVAQNLVAYNQQLSPEGEA